MHRRWKVFTKLKEFLEPRTGLPFGDVVNVFVLFLSVAALLIAILGVRYASVTLNEARQSGAEQIKAMKAQIAESKQQTLAVSKTLPVLDGARTSLKNVESDLEQQRRLNEATVRQLNRQIAIGNQQLTTGRQEVELLGSHVREMTSQANRHPELRFSISCDSLPKISAPPAERDKARPQTLSWEQIQNHKCMRVEVGDPVEPVSCVATIQNLGDLDALKASLAFDLAFYDDGMSRPIPSRGTSGFHAAEVTGPSAATGHLEIATNADIPQFNLTHQSSSFKFSISPRHPFKGVEFGWTLAGQNSHMATGGVSFSFQYAPWIHTLPVPPWLNPGCP